MFCFIVCVIIHVKLCSFDSGIQFHVKLFCNRCSFSLIGSNFSKLCSASPALKRMQMDKLPRPAKLKRSCSHSQLVCPVPIRAESTHPRLLPLPKSAAAPRGLAIAWPFCGAGAPPRRPRSRTPRWTTCSASRLSLLVSGSAGSSQPSRGSHGKVPSVLCLLGEVVFPDR